MNTNGLLQILRRESLVEMFNSATNCFRDLPAFSSMGTTLSYGEIDWTSRFFASFLQQGLGDKSVKKGDRVAVMLPNLLQYPVAVIGILRAGGAVVNVNPFYTARELGHQLKDSGARVIVVLENFAHTVEKARKDCPGLDHTVVTGVGDMLHAPKGWAINFALKYVERAIPPHRLDAIAFLDAMKKGRKLLASFDEPYLSEHDLALLQYTGGTTGISKGAMLTHGNLLANAWQGTECFKRNLEVGKEAVITALPLYHIFAFMVNFLCFFALGGHNHLIANPRDMRGFVKTLRKIRTGFTAITGLDPLFRKLLEDPDFWRVNFSRLKHTLAGGMATSSETAKRWRNFTGCEVTEGYGLTEMSPLVCVAKAGEPFTGSVGEPVIRTECSVRDDYGNELPSGECGELWIRGPQVMKGYWKNPEETAQVFMDGGWLKTGDIATIDSAGRITIVGRKKDMILVSGLNVYPSEVEEVILEHPAIQEAAIVGIPNKTGNEVVTLFAVLKPGNYIELKDIQRYCKKRERLSGYKIPKQMIRVDELPKNPLGKILKWKLREMALETTSTIKR